MKGSELRIGNLFIEEYSSKIIEVIGLEKIKITFSGLFLDKWQAKPIPLTEEWLVKFGFVKHKTTDIYPTFAKQMFNWNDGILYIIGYGFMNHIKHVHQLQNLYFALTGEELIINN